MTKKNVNLKNYEKDDHKGQGQAAWVAKADIAARAEAAYERHTAFFTDAQHQSRVELAKQLARNAARLYSAIFETARDGKEGPFTEVKFDRVEFARGARDRLAQTLRDNGFKDDEFEYRIQSQSFRILVK